jgi:hypothetical protein
MSDIMNKQDYERYQKNVARFLEREVLDRLLPLPETEEKSSTKPYFSTRPCDVCCYSLGGNRMNMGGPSKTDSTWRTYSVCEDCVYYNEHGRLEDSTMQRIENSK